MKKKSLLLTTLLLIVGMIVSLCACGSTYGTIKKAFEKEGYVESANANAIQAAIVEEIFGEDYETVCTVHVLEQGVITYAIVVEFKSTKEMEEQLTKLADDKTIGSYFKDFVADLQKSDIVNGNCVLVGGFLTGALDIFKSTK